MKPEEFQKLIIKFYEKEGREFPWRDTNNEYQALVAELMLQKTSAEQVEPVYRDFISKYPEPEDILGKDTDIFDELGLKKREEYIKNIAKFFKENKALTRDKLMNITGVGQYTANAFLSIHKERRLPIIDANVERVLRKHFNIQDERSPRRNKELQELAKSLLPDKKIREYNLGLLDYGHRLNKNPEYELSSDL